jgi:C_GCAxxG_C_C family probable redox protein
MFNETAATTIDKSLQYFAEGYNCAEAVLLAVAQAAGRNCPCIPRMASGLGGGVGRQGELCGTLNGGALVIGLLHGRDHADEAEIKEAVTIKTAEFVRRFAEVNGAVCCRDLLGLELNTEAGTRQFHDLNLRQERCTVVMKNAVQILLELLNEWEAEQGS